jgi:hypothetical protein
MPDVEVIYEPEEWPDFLGTERHAELKAWLIANGIDPADVPVREAISIEPLTLGGDLAIRYTAYLRAANGLRYLDEATGEAAQEERLVPLTTAPPPHWRTSKENDR